MQDASTAACAAALITHWISRFGVPDDITTDRGPAFISELWAAIARLMGTTLHSTTAYNPAANGMVERSHRTLKAALMARCNDEDWLTQLPWVLLGLRTVPKSDADTSPAERVYGEALAVPGEFFPTTDDKEDTSLARLREVADKFRPCIKTFTDRTKHYKPIGLDSSTHVFVRTDAHRAPLTRPYRGPYRVVRREDKAYLLAIHGREDWITVDRLKPAFLMNDEEEETGRRPRVPPQHRGPEMAPAAQKRERPKKAPETTPEEMPQLTSRRRGPLRKPKRYED